MGFAQLLELGQKKKANINIMSIKFSQAHQLPDKIEKAYLRSDLFHLKE